jgi:hypothetical protein
MFITMIWNSILYDSQLPTDYCSQCPHSYGQLGYLIGAWAQIQDFFSGGEARGSSKKILPLIFSSPGLPLPAINFCISDIPAGGGGWESEIMF